MFSVQNFKMFTPDKMAGGLSALDTSKYGPLDPMAHLG